MGHAEYCGQCAKRSRCIRKPSMRARQVTKIVAGIRHNRRTAAAGMIDRFDTDRGRHYYSRRMGTVEPVFANITCTYGLNRFSLRGREKVDAQWKLFCMVNIGKIAAHWRRETER